MTFFGLAPGGTRARVAGLVVTSKSRRNSGGKASAADRALSPDDLLHVGRGEHPVGALDDQAIGPVPPGTLGLLARAEGAREHQRRREGLEEEGASRSGKGERAARGPEPHRVEHGRAHERRHERPAQEAAERRAHAAHVSGEVEERVGEGGAQVREDLNARHAVDHADDTEADKPAVEEALGPGPARSPRPGAPRPRRRRRARKGRRRGRWLRGRAPTPTGPSGRAVARSNGPPWRPREPPRATPTARVPSERPLARRVLGGGSRQAWPRAARASGRSW